MPFSRTAGVSPPSRKTPCSVKVSVVPPAAAANSTVVDRDGDESAVGLHRVAVDDPLGRDDVLVGRLVGEHRTPRGAAAVGLGAADPEVERVVRRARGAEPTRLGLTARPGGEDALGRDGVGPSDREAAVLGCPAVLVLVMILFLSVVMSVVVMCGGCRGRRLLRRQDRPRGPRPAGRAGAPRRRAGRRTSPRRSWSPAGLEPAGAGAADLLGADQPARLEDGQVLHDGRQGHVEWPGRARSPWPGRRSRRSTRSRRVGSPSARKTSSTG